MSDKTQTQSTQAQDSAPSPARTSSPGAARAPAKTTTDRELAEDELKRVSAGRGTGDDHLKH